MEGNLWSNEWQDDSIIPDEEIVLLDLSKNMNLIKDEIEGRSIKVHAYSRLVSTQLSQDCISPSKNVLCRRALLAEMMCTMKTLRNELDVGVERCHAKTHSIEMINENLIVHQDLNTQCYEMSNDNKLMCLTDQLESNVIFFGNYRLK